MKKIIILFTISLLIISCERKTETLGPNLSDIYGGFQVFEDFEASRNNVDFYNSESVVFTCRFSKQVKWTIHVIGQTSGAKKVLTGFSNFIDETNGGAWDGTTTMLPMFKNEANLAYLTVDAIDTAYSDTLNNLISIDGVRDNGGSLVSDFNNGLNPGFNVFVQSGADMRFDTVTDPKSPEGTAFYEMSGDVAFADDLGNIMMPKSAFTDSISLNTNGEVVYFNVFAKKGPQAVSDIFVFQFIEEDNDIHEYVFQGLTEEWQQFSIAYADLTTTITAGGGFKNPDKLAQIVVLPIGIKLPFEGFIDYMVFTENGPLIP